MIPPCSILMDLDGSVLDGDGNLDTELATLIRENHQIHWIMVTGRAFSSASLTPVAGCVPRHSAHVFDGGATIASLDGRQMVRRVLKARELRIARMKITPDRAKYIYASVGLAGGILWEKSEGELKSVPISYRTNSIGRFWSELSQHMVAKLTVLQSPPFQSLGPLWAAQNEHRFDITRRGVNKATGAQTIFESRGLDPKNSVFVFNDENDMPIVKSPFFSRLKLLKVGNRLPYMPSHRHVPTPRDVARALTDFGVASTNPNSAARKYVGL